MKNSTFFLKRPLKIPLLPTNSIKEYRIPKDWMIHFDSWSWKCRKSELNFAPPSLIRYWKRERRARSADRYKFQWYDAIFRGLFLSSSSERRKIPFRPIKIGSSTVEWSMISGSTRRPRAFLLSRQHCFFFFFFSPFRKAPREERTWQEEGIPTKEAQYINFRR